MDTARVAPDTFSFEVLPADTGTFEPFIVDVPTMIGEDAAARRCYFSAMALLRDVADVEDFEVYSWGNEGAPRSGRKVGPGGFES